jgi:hypothetical protein
MEKTMQQLLAVEKMKTSDVRGNKLITTAVNA